MYKNLLLSLSLLLAAPGLQAQLKTADDFFHGGAQLYIHGKKDDSKKEIFTGLQFYPTDPKLNGMAMLLKKEEQQQQQQQQQNQQQQDQQQNQQQQNQQSGQNNQNQKPDSQPQQQKQKQPAEQQPKPEEKQAQANQAQEQKDNKEEQDRKEAEAYAAGQMTPKQAEQLLDAEKGDEKVLTLKPEGKPQDRSRPFKDW